MMEIMEEPVSALLEVFQPLTIARTVSHVLHVFSAWIPQCQTLRDPCSSNGLKSFLLLNRFFREKSVVTMVHGLCMLL